MFSVIFNRQVTKLSGKLLTDRIYMLVYFPFKMVDAASGSSDVDRT